MRNLKGRPPCSGLFGRAGRWWLAELELPVDERQTAEAACASSTSSARSSRLSTVRSPSKPWRRRLPRPPPEASPRRDRRPPGTCSSRRPGRQRRRRPLRAFAERTAARRGGNVATVAVARKLSVLAWHLLTREQDYAFQRPSRVRRKLRRARSAGQGRRRSGRAATTTSGSGSSRSRPRLPTSGSSPTGSAPGQSRVRARHRGAHLTHCRLRGMAEMSPGAHAEPEAPCDRKAAPFMTAVELKEKFRNFPEAELRRRLAEARKL